MMLRAAFAAFVLAAGTLPALAAAPAPASTPVDTEALPLKPVEFSFEGPFGLYDRAALQRGFQVYKEVCSACHSLNRVAFHDLAQPGGPGFSEAQAKAIAAAYKVPAGPNDKGETVDANGSPLMRAGIIADHFPPPFPNEQAARTANNGALPPDMSLLASARKGGARYIYSIVTGDGMNPPHGFPMRENMHYDPYFAGRQIAMPPPLVDSSVTYSDGTKATVSQEAQDVSTFLAWASDPHMEQRKHIGFMVVAFLLLLSALLFLSYRKLWAGEH